MDEQILPNEADTAITPPTTKYGKDDERPRTFLATSVTPACKERLFQDALNARSSDAESQLVLQRLRQFDAAIGNCFELKEPTATHLNFRLLYEEDFETSFLPPTPPTQPSRDFHS
jgi:hypothetical protein